MIYLCDGKNPAAAKALKDFDSWEETMKQKKKFLDLQVEAIESDRKKIWRAFFEDMKAQGILKSDVVFEDVAMQFDEETKQFFLHKKGDMPGSLHALLSGIFNK